jgi:serine protease Do
VVWRSDGLIATNAHVARSAHAVVTLPDGRRLAARTVVRDPSRDLALLQLDADALGPPALDAAVPGDPSRLRPGEVVLALGHPLGHPNALAAGVVHAATDAPPAWLRARGGGRPVRVIRADVRLLPGNSGGPLADAAGRVVGINAMVVGGLGVAISIEEVVALAGAHDRAAGRRAA